MFLSEMEMIILLRFGLGIPACRGLLSFCKNYNSQKQIYSDFFFDHLLEVCEVIRLQLLAIIISNQY